MESGLRSAADDSPTLREVPNAEALLEIVLAVLRTVDVRGSGGHAERVLARYMGLDDARLFLHELRAFLRSPCADLESWDRCVQYGVDLRELAARGARDARREH